MELSRYGTVGIGLLVVVALTPVWAMYGALAPGGHGEHGGGDGAFDITAFVEQALDYTRRHETSDGIVEAPPGEMVPIVAQQFGFMPRELRLQTGETYELEVVSKDVIHGFSLQQGAGSLNAVLVPGTPTRITLTPMQPGEFLLLCNEYCGLGHQVMSGRIVVEGPPVERDSGETNEHGSAADEHDAGVDRTAQPSASEPSGGTPSPDATNSHGGGGHQP